MRTIEFEATVTNGVIEIPPEYRGKIAASVHVKLSMDDFAVQPQPTILDQWLASPIRMADFQPLSREEAHER